MGRRSVSGVVDTPADGAQSKATAIPGRPGIRQWRAKASLGYAHTACGSTPRSGRA
ncbi:protein of unknown function [Burkholderia multivorans]